MVPGDYSTPALSIIVGKGVGVHCYVYKYIPKNIFQKFCKRSAPFALNYLSLLQECEVVFLLFPLGFMKQCCKLCLPLTNINSASNTR